MGLFSRKKKITSQDLARCVFELWLGKLREMRRNAKEILIEFELDKTKIEKIDIDCEKKLVNELGFLYLFIVKKRLCNFFIEHFVDISNSLNALLVENKFDIDYFYYQVEEYIKAWDGAIEREESKNDDSCLNDPLYCICKLASIRFAGEGKDFNSFEILTLPDFSDDEDEILRTYERVGFDPSKVIMFNALFLAFDKELCGLLKGFEVV